MTDHLETTAGNDQDAYAHALKVIEDSRLVYIGEKDKKPRETVTRGALPDDFGEAMRRWTKSAIPPYEEKEDVTPSESVIFKKWDKEKILVTTEEIEIAKWCAVIIAGTIGFFAGLLWAAVLWWLHDPGVTFMG